MSNVVNQKNVNFSIQELATGNETIFKTGTISRDGKGKTNFDYEIFGFSPINILGVNSLAPGQTAVLQTVDERAYYSTFGEDGSRKFEGDGELKFFQNSGGSAVEICVYDLSYLGNLLAGLAVLYEVDTWAELEETDLDSLLSSEEFESVNGDFEGPKKLRLIMGASEINIPASLELLSIVDHRNTITRAGNSTRKVSREFVHEMGFEFVGEKAGSKIINIVHDDVLFGEIFFAGDGVSASWVGGESALLDREFLEIPQGVSWDGGQSPVLEREEQI